METATYKEADEVFAALAKGALSLMENRKAAMLTLTYLGAVRSVSA